MRLTPYPAYKLHAAVGLISTAHQAVPRTMPDAANALSGLQTTCSRRSDKHSAIRQFRAPCRMLPTPYPVYKLHAAVGLISTAHQAVPRTVPDAANALSGLQTTRSRRSDKHSAIRQFRAPCRMLPTPYPVYKLHAAVGLISTAHQAVPRTVPDVANALSGL
ncbi:hypothetical protein NLN83_15305 [Citrobacter portucalensis]|uniref:hypothetical protein n=1 Tax=Citrobacter portucalensis TaxID=1639133 RepID=UPI00226B045A|nr:hypothetical protein [Citrobacter portucalensis]MCX9033125.1 hypothetical protein [Citrobacter portucalensis]